MAPHAVITFVLPSLRPLGRIISGFSRGVYKQETRFPVAVTDHDAHFGAHFINHGAGIRLRRHSALVNSSHNRDTLLCHSMTLP